MAGKSNKGSKAKNLSNSVPENEKDTKQSAEKAPKTEAGETGSRSLMEIISAANPEKLETLSRNLTEAMFESQEILREMMSSRSKDGLDTKSPDPFGAGDAMSKVGENLARHPERIFEAQLSLWEGHMSIWRSLLMEKTETKPEKDKRFSDPEWTANPFFDVIRQTYQLNSSWLQKLIDSASELDEETKLKASFFARQTSDAFSPTNFFSTNPAALRAMMETGGDSLVKGLRQARADLKRGHGRLLISQTDGTPFEVGKNIATALGKVVFRNDLIELLQYEPVTETVYKRPLLIFPPWINKFYILDLRVENSMIRWLTEQGISVFVVSWRSADKSMSHITWDDYVESGAYAALDQVINISGVKEVNTVGYCIGGTMLASALARMAQDNDKRISSATFFASQSDFAEAGDLKVFTDEQAIAHIETIIDENGGVMAGEDMAETFNYLRASDLVWRYVVDNYMLGKKPQPFDLLFWNSDQTNIPGPTHKTYLRDLYGDNALAAGKFKVLGKTVKLKDISIPTLFQAGRDDHISPFSSVYRAARAFGGKPEFVLAGSGHIAGVVNHPAANKYQHWTNPDLPETADEWLTGAELNEGSWWPHWLKWLSAKSGKKVEAVPVEDHGLGDAPGSYVKQTLEDLGMGTFTK